MAKPPVTREAVGVRGLELFRAGCVLVLIAGPVAAAWGSDGAPPARGLAQESRSFKAVCAKCHNLQLVMDTPMSYDAWHDTVQTMMDRGATGTDQQFADVMDYLHR